MAPIPGVFVMKPSRPGRASGDFFCDRLDAIIDMRHPLVRLGRLMPWSDFDARFGKFYKPLGRPANPRQDSLLIAHSAEDHRTHLYRAIATTAKATA